MMSTEVRRLNQTVPMRDSIWSMFSALRARSILPRTSRTSAPSWLARGALAAAGGLLVPRAAQFIGQQPHLRLEFFYSLFDVHGALFRVHSTCPCNRFPAA
jgi:hypothetical protein